MKCRSHVGSSILRIRALGRRILQKTVPDREHRAGERISAEGRRICGGLSASLG